MSKSHIGRQTESKRIHGAELVLEVFIAAFTSVLSTLFSTVCRS